LTAERRHLPQVTLRSAREDDSAMLMALRNDPDAIAFSVSGRAVTAEEHERWFARVLADQAPHRLWIAESNGEPVGQLRIDIAADSGTVSIAVSPEHRGRGIATAMLQALVSNVAAEGTPSRLTAVVRSDNAASRRAFAAVGFREVVTEAVFLELEWP
jgi:UDP-2,4-diacetamido-2,4,6-trideoxy-beta-L-altropyranose hydrolase